MSSFPTVDSYGFSGPAASGGVWISAKDPSPLTPKPSVSIGILGWGVCISNKKSSIAFVWTLKTPHKLAWTLKSDDFPIGISFLILFAGVYFDGSTGRYFSKMCNTFLWILASSKNCLRRRSLAALWIQIVLVLPLGQSIFLYETLWNQKKNMAHRMVW